MEFWISFDFSFTFLKKKKRIHQTHYIYIESFITSDRRPCGEREKTRRDNSSLGFLQVFDLELNKFLVSAMHRTAGKKRREAEKEGN